MAMFMPGPLELLIIFGVVGAGILSVIFVVVVGVRRRGTSQSSNPNLRPCPDCGRYISIRATTCPQCGGTMKGG
jgi:hypothetical protein